MGYKKFTLLAGAFVEVIDFISDAVFSVQLLNAAKKQHADETCGVVEVPCSTIQPYVVASWSFFLAAVLVCVYRMIYCCFGRRWTAVPFFNIFIIFHLDERDAEDAEAEIFVPAIVTRITEDIPQAVIAALYLKQIESSTGSIFCLVMSVISLLHFMNSFAKNIVEGNVKGGPLLVADAGLALAALVFATSLSLVLFLAGGSGRIIYFLPIFVFGSGILVSMGIHVIQQMKKL